MNQPACIVPEKKWGWAGSRCDLVALLTNFLYWRRGWDSNPRDPFEV